MQASDMKLDDVPQFRLPSCLDFTSADALQVELRACLARAGAVLLDGSDVERVSTACLQLLVAASATCRAAGAAFRLSAPSNVLGKAAADLGLVAALGLEAASWPNA